MTELSPGFINDEACLKARVGLVALRLSLEVNRLRALRGNGREDRFAGVLMRDSDIAAMCADLISDPMPDNTDLISMLDTARARYDGRVAGATGLPVYERLVRVYGLSVAEEEIFAIALAAGLDPRIARVLGYLNEDMAQQYLTLGLAQRLLGETLPLGDLWAALGPDGRLLRFGLLGEQSSATAAAGFSVPASVLRLIVSGPSEVEIAQQLPTTGPIPSGPVLIVADTPIDALIALTAPGPAWLTEGGTLEAARALGTLAAINGQVHIISGWDSAAPDQRTALMRSLGRLSVVITTRPALWSGAGVPWVHHDASASTRSDRLEFWRGLIGNEAAPLLADAGQIQPDRLWRMSREATDASALETLIRNARSEPMQGLADLIPARFEFDDLELPARQKQRLKNFAARRAADATVLEDWGLGPALGANRGAIALFTGPSGVGKTMAAGIVAHIAGLDLWRINIATLVSKYIGETEANLDRIFRAADRADVMLFFDEAEALFSKRAEVKEARDRYANMEMAYLLQRIEDFRGMAVLASNMSTSLEPAMQRRFDLVMEFQMPDAAARRRLWGRIETGRAPLAEDVDLDALADGFELAGGHIRQAILSAAHDAVTTGAITQDHLMKAVAQEYAKLGKPIRKEQFGSHFAKVRSLGG